MSPIPTRFQARKVGDFGLINPENVKNFST